jgi:Uma2 family endonuclease
MASIKPSRGVRRRRWTKGEYRRLADLGFFRGQRVELLEGQIVVQSPQSAEHWTAVDRATAALQRVFGTGYLVRMQGPLDLGQATEPEPDICVVAGCREDFEHAHPTSALLVLEISDTTLHYDRRRKASLYARADIADYWIVNLVQRQVEVYRDPIPDPGRYYGYRYATRADRLPPAVLHPLALPQAALAVADLLP